MFGVLYSIASKRGLCMRGSNIVYALFQFRVIFISFDLQLIDLF